MLYEFRYRKQKNVKKPVYDGICVININIFFQIDCGD